MTLTLVKLFVRVLSPLLLPMILYGGDLWVDPIVMEDVDGKAKTARKKK